MLSDLLKNKSKIGPVESIAYVAYWLSIGTSSIDDLEKCIQGHPSIRISYIRPVLGLFEAMSLVDIDGNYISNKIDWRDIDCQVAPFLTWFSPIYVEFLIQNDIIDLDKISYSIVKKKYILSSTAINPIKYACFRNLLIDLQLIEYNYDGSYSINKLIDETILKTQKRKISENELIDKLAKERELGILGEEFVLAYEKQRITNKELQKEIKIISQIDVAAGFDIVSFRDNASQTFDRFIEVKTFSGKPHFYWSKNEIDKARLMGDAYCIYLVDYDKMQNIGYTPQCIINPIKNIMDAEGWIITPQSFLIEPL